MFIQNGLINWGRPALQEPPAKGTGSATLSGWRQIPSLAGTAVGLLEMQRFLFHGN